MPEEQERNGGGSLSRRSLLKAGGLAVAGASLSWRSLAAFASTSGARWSDAATWGGSLPTEGTVVRITTAIVLDRDARVAGVVIEPGGSLTFDPSTNVTLESTGNVIVRGSLGMAPANGRIIHVLRFVGIDESNMVGGGDDPVASDVGLWVMDAGQVSIRGTGKLPWTRASGSLAAGTTKITVLAAPTGWRPGDELAITPTASPKVSAFYAAYDTVNVVAVNGNEVTLDRPLQHAHPAVPVKKGLTMTAEVLNLTRNARIEGTPTGRTHTFFRSSRPQHISHAALRWVGPQMPNPTNPKKPPEPVLGRYGLHLHLSGAGSVGSMIRGVVIQDAGNRCFVPHSSNGVSFVDCISHNTYESAYWWDYGTYSHDILFERCVASACNGSDNRNTGFRMGQGDRNVARGCVAVGSPRGNDGNGFFWQGGASPFGIWTFEDCVSHNNKAYGIFVWQNTGSRHTMTRYVGYHNGVAALFQGAYGNSFGYGDGVFYGNGLAGVQLKAVSRVPHRLPPTTFADCVFDGAAISQYGIVVLNHNHEVPPEQPTVVIRSQFTGHSKAGIAWEPGVSTASTIDTTDIVDCRFSGNEFWLANSLLTGTIIRVNDSAHGSIKLTPASTGGEYRPEWNARVTPIPPFTPKLT